MKEELKAMVREHFGIPHPDTKKPVKNPQLDPQDPQQAAILRRKVEYEGLSEPEKQEIQWGQRNFDPKLKEKADRIVKAQKGKDIFAGYLADKNDIFVNYVLNALVRAGYIERDRIGSPSIGIDHLYALPEPVLCPHCKEKLGPAYSKKND